MADRFSGARWAAGQTGSPVLTDSIGWLDCAVAHAYPGGDHTIFVGEVLAAATPRRVAPVLFHSRAWSRLAEPLPDRISIADTGLLAVLRARGFADPRLAGIARNAARRGRPGPAVRPARRRSPARGFRPGHRLGPDHPA